ncbi:MAG: TetR family transcriptional regulator [Desulfovibrio sp.]|jgi:TetR/AcrR family transcriptional repressor of nem operon|uniref:TetR/AcrR family transcriptional regulator n=1 Tax=Desulfovibrio sp. TaxID=885 RepID=UPI00135E2D55|nr:TetR/AcrR family transcriptional regulator [Desulfovibrio sp.]MTJ93853.1 TetR family transcriptional regulator [Desulfovibrio sp.]
MKENARDKIIATGVDMVAISGFNATGIESILKAAGVPKGSFYHHFGSKENFGIEVINLFAERYAQKLRSFFDDHNVEPLERIRNYLEHSIEHLTQENFSKGCLIGNLGQELADQNERFRDRLAEVFNDWLALFADCLQQAQQAGSLNPRLDTQKLASFLLSGWEGAILRAKVMRSPEPLKQFVGILFTTVLTAG